MPDSVVESSTNTSTPNYPELLKFLVKPFLEHPDSLRIDCEVSESKGKVWLRLAFEGADKGRVFGRGGRNIQAIRAVLEAAARSVGYSAHLDIYGGSPAPGDGDSEANGSGGRPQPRRGHSRRPPHRPES